MRLAISPLIKTVFFICLASSCQKDVVSIDDVNVSASPVIAIPIGSVDLTLEHLIDPNDPDDTLISANSENTYQVVLAQENVVNTGFDNLVQIPSQSLLNRTMKMGNVDVADLNATQSVTLDDIASSVGGSLQSGLTVSVDDISTSQTISLDDIANDAGGSFQSSLNVGGVSATQSISLNTIANTTGGALQSSLSVGSISAGETITLEDISNDAGGTLQSSLTIDSVNTNQSITLGDMANDIGGTFQTGIVGANGSNSIFPPFSESNVGTYSGGSMGNFTSATLTSGSMTLAVTNNWPVALTMAIDLVNTATSATIVSYNFTNVAANGGTASQSKSLAGVTLPSTLGFKIVSVTSPGSGFSQVAIDTSDAIDLNVATANMVASSYVAPFPAVSETNLGTYSAGSLGNFTSATFSGGSMSLSLTNQWPVPLSMGVDLVDTATNLTILSFNFSNVAANGGSSTQTNSLAGKTLPNSLGLKISSVTSPGSTGPVTINLADSIALAISTSNMVASSFVAPFPAVSETNVGTFSGGSMGNFSSATFSGGTMDLSLTNNWAVPMSMSVEVVDTNTNTTLLSYSFSNVSANGGSSTQTASLAGKTLTNAIGLKITAVSSPGSTGSVAIDMTDDIALGIATSNVVVSNFVAPFPAFSESNVGTYSAGNLGNFTSASFSAGSLTLGLGNYWPVALSMSIDLVNTVTDSTILSYNFTNISANGGTASQSQSLAGVTLPSTLGFKVVSVSSPGSPTTHVSVDMTDTLSLSVSSANMVASSFIAPFPAINQTNVGTYSAGTISTFSTASFSQGTMAITLDNDWPVDLSMGLDVVNTANGDTLLTYAFTNVPADGGSVTQSNSLVGITLPNTIGLKINSVSSPGSSGSVNIDLTDAISFTVASTNLKVYNAVVDLDTTTLASQSDVVDLGVAGVEIGEIAFNTCDLNYEFISTLQADVEVALKMPSTDKNGMPIDTTILIAANQTTTGTIQLSNTVLDLTTDSVQSHSRLPIELTATVLGTSSMVTVDSGHAIVSAFDMDNISFAYIEGYFGDSTVAVPSSTVDLDLDILNQFNGEITFEDPKLSVGVVSSVGIPVALDLRFISYRNGTGYPLNASSQLFPYPTVIGDSAMGTLVYDNTNSSLSSVFTFPFDSLAYGGAVTVNPDTTTYGKYNFITSDSKIAGDILIDLPFTFTTAGLSLSRTIDSTLNLSSYLESSLYEFDYAKLLINTTSSLPVDATLDLKFYAADGTLLLVKTINALESGVPNVDGVVIAPSVTFSELELTASDFSLLTQARVAVAEATMNSFNQGTVPVKLRTDATIKIDLGVEAKVNFEL
ncbi:MAG: hypothetical protein P8Q49_07660 [Schleiferiaceae bacterium]|nr:hypothetical protein [Schleiferiaceae bacterium]